MICILALLVFGIIGIFSTTHRRIAREALGCVFRRVTFRPCSTGLDKRLRAELVGQVLRKNPKVGKWIYAQFEIISWVALVLLIVSVVFSGIGMYNFAVYGDCNGPSKTGFCPFNPGVGQVSGEGDSSEILPVPPVEGNPRRGSSSPELVLVEFGCFTCANTAKMIPVITQLLEENPEIAVEYRTYPIPAHRLSYESAVAAECAFRQEKFWEYHDLLFARQKNATNQSLSFWAGELDMDVLAFDRCRSGWVPQSTNGGPVLTPPAPSYFATFWVDQDLDLGKVAGIYGTPTIFIKDQVFVGVQPFKKLDKAVKDALRG